MRSSGVSGPGPAAPGAGAAAGGARGTAGRGPATDPLSPPRGDVSRAGRGGQEARKTGGVRLDPWCRAGVGLGAGAGDGAGAACAGGEGRGLFGPPGTAAGGGDGDCGFFREGANSGRISDRFPVPPLILREIPSPRAARPEKPARVEPARRTPFSSWTVSPSVEIPTVTSRGMSPPLDAR